MQNFIILEKGDRSDRKALLAKRVKLERKHNVDMKEKQRIAWISSENAENSTIVLLSAND